jgi:hypothetical protein
MTKRTLQLLLLSCISSVGAMGQINCSTSLKLVCQIPFSTGAFNTNGGVTPESLVAAQGIATAINSAIATQISQLPLASASAGTVVLYRAGVPETYNNLGPILTDRAQTIGRHRIFIGFTASQFFFTDINGIPLGNVPFTFEATAKDNNGNVVSNTFTSESTNIHFKVNQYIVVGTYGITDKIDVSMIVPIERVSIGAATFNNQAYVLNADNTALLVPPYSPAATYTPGTASGLGDITFNGKYVVWRGEHATFSGGMNFRTPTGDALNYLGSGAWGFNPYLVYSYLWKVSPHAKIGYQWNTATELNNPTSTPGGNQALPGGLQYDLGGDWAATKHLTVAIDLLGSQYLNSTKLALSTVPLTFLPTPTSTTKTSVNLPTVVRANSTYTINDLSAGVKWNPYRDLVLSGNVLFQLNNVGMRSRPTPLVGISYKF